MSLLDREIKFKFLLENGENTKPYYLKELIDSDAYINIECEYGSKIKKALQYTELKDINLVEIYDGDIVECRFRYRDWLPSFVEEVSILNTNLTLPFAREYFIGNKEYRDFVGLCKIIGNIYNKPELLEA